MAEPLGRRLGLVGQLALRHREPRLGQQLLGGSLLPAMSVAICDVAPVRLARMRF
jgi:hypothetical protein